MPPVKLVYTGTSGDNDLDARLKRVVYRPTTTEAELIAHRGFSNAAPENTLAAFGLAAGRMHSAEFDVQVSSDGVPVVIHDATVDRTTDGTGTVSAMTLSALQALDAGSKFDARYAGTKIPTLSAVLAYCASRFRLIYPEIKGYRTTADIAVMMQALIDAGLEERAIVQSASIGDLAYVRAASKRLTFAYVAANDTQWGQALPIVAADGNGIMFTSYTVLLADPAKVAAARALGVDVVAWTVDTTDIMRQLLAIGVTRIVTNTLTSTGDAL